MKVQLVLKGSSALKTLNMKENALLRLIRGIQEKGEESVTTTKGSYIVTGVFVTSDERKAEAILMK